LLTVDFVAVFVVLESALLVPLVPRVALVALVQP
jgi:hypothetical protein